ncbi:MAG TPA: zinc ribbon domain-containing protein [Solirubrobacteraceae bacterium]|nr:zinc ribbon domain-containing protein [Solirubrobacteraceae bacterium]
MPAEDVAEQSVEVPKEANRPGVALALAGALVMAVAVFLPRVNGPIHAREKNMLIESGNDWLFIVFAVLIATSVYRIHRNAERTRSAAAVLLVAVIATGVALYDGTGQRFATKNVLVVLTGPSAKSPKRATPGIGIYGAGVGSLLALVGGVWIMGWGYGGKEEERRFKVCPDCAEKVLADTQVCKHCQYRFA